VRKFGQKLEHPEHIRRAAEKIHLARFAQNPEHLEHATEICGEEDSPATRGVHLIDYVAASHVPLEGPVVHEPLVQRAADAEIIGGHRSRLTAEHALEAGQLSDLPHGTDLRALAAAAVVQKSAVPHEHREIVAPAVVGSIGASALLVDSEDVHRTGGGALQLVEAGSRVPVLCKACFDPLQHGRFGSNLRLSGARRGRCNPEGIVPNRFSERKADFFQTWAQSTSSALKVDPLQE
jgi:hypothetical protein